MQRKHIRGMTSEPVSSPRGSTIGLALALQRDVELFSLSSGGKKAASRSVVGESAVAR